MTNYEKMIPTIHGAALALVNVPLALYIYRGDTKFESQGNKHLNNDKYISISTETAIFTPIILFAASYALASHLESQYYKEMTSSYKVTTRYLEYTKLGMAGCLFVKASFYSPNSQFAYPVDLRSIMFGFTLVIDAVVDYFGRESIPYILEDNTVGVIGNALIGLIATDGH